MGKRAKDITQITPSATAELETAVSTVTRTRRRFRLALGRLGPGLITGAADDDPSGIATYSQAGAQFGLNMLWTPLFTYPLAVAVQSTCARIGRVTGVGLAANLTRILPRWAVLALVAALFVVNTVNIGADLVAMGAATTLIAGGWSQTWFTLLAAAVSLLLQIFVPYHRYVFFLKWLTLVLFAYVGVVFIITVDWADVARHVVMPRAPITGGWLTVVVAVFGTTISPYLFFWEASEEVEEMEVKDRPDLLHTPPKAARHELNRIRIDNFVGMGFSNAIAFFIILTTAVTLHASGVTDIQTSAQAAEALRPLAGASAFVLFSLGILGTGLLAMPVLAGASAYAVAEVFGWREGLERPVEKARGFYAVIGLSMVSALAMVLSPLDPIKALFWSAVLNGIISVPILGTMMLLATRRDEMGHFVASPGQRIFGWAATTVMAAAVVAMFLL